MKSQDYMTLVAHHYNQAPLLGGLDSMRAWEELAVQTRTTYRALVQDFPLAVLPVDVAEPYATPTDMFEDIERHVIKVSNVNHLHPLWDADTNIQFRVVHDVLGHYPCHADFSWEGELLAWSWHSRYVQGSHAQGALFTEAVGQVAWMLELGGGQFGPQKACLLPQYLQWVDVEGRVAA